MPDLKQGPLDQLQPLEDSDDGAISDKPTLPSFSDRTYHIPPHHPISRCLNHHTTIAGIPLLYSSDTGLLTLMEGDSAPLVTQNSPRIDR